MSVKIGEMTRVAIIQRKATATDDAGQPQETWEDVARWRCKCESLSTRETFASRQAEVSVTLKLSGWYMREVHGNAPLMRIKLGERYLNIVSVAVSQDKARQMELLCGEVQPWGNQAL